MNIPTLILKRTVTRKVPTSFVQDGPIWVNRGQEGSSVAKMGKDGLRGVNNGQKGSRAVKRGLVGAKKDQVGSSGVK